MTMEWKDTTSYSRHSPRVADCWSLDLGRAGKIDVLSGHRHFPGQWVTHFWPHYDSKPVGSIEDLGEDEAKAAALVMASNWLNKLIHDARPLLDVLPLGARR